MHRAWLMVVLGPTLLLVLACPPSEVSVSVSESGARRLILACDPQGLDACTTTTSPDISAPLWLRTWLLDPSNVLAAEGNCVPLGTNACTSFKSLDEQARCAREKLNDALDASMSGGLTFDDLESPLDATLGASLHAAGSTGCTFDSIVACIVFDTTALGSDTYDVACAVCDGGPRAGVGCLLDDGCAFGVCPSPGQCGIDVCRQLLK
jgi:hypothetical protein